MSGNDDILTCENIELSTDSGEASDMKPEAEPNHGENQHLSKRLQRKLKKHDRWLELLPEKRLKEKMKKKQRRQEARERGESLGPTRKMLKLNSMEKSSCKVKIVLDCSFDSYMGERDIMKLTKQVGFCYSANRRAENPLQFYVCGLHGQMKQRFEAIGDYKNWDVNFTEENYQEVFDKDKIVYLTSDSPNLLDDLSDYQAYVIGGLVDHNHYKGLCYELAEERGIPTAQLPIGQYVEMKSRKILTVNHVFEILLKYTETKDWKKSFFSVIPQRKVAGDNDTEKKTIGTKNDIHVDTKHHSQSQEDEIKNTENDELCKKDDDLTGCDIKGSESATEKDSFEYSTDSSKIQSCIDSSEHNNASSSSKRGNIGNLSLNDTSLKRDNISDSS